MKNYFIFFFLGSIMLLFVSGCSKENPQITDDFTLRFLPKSGQSTFFLSRKYVDNAGVTYFLDRADFYVSSIKFLTGIDSIAHEINDSYLLVHPNGEFFSFNNIPIGNYTGIKFTLGIDSITNHGEPTAFSPSHALSPKSPSMYWDLQQGYKFLVLKGKVDSTGGTGANKVLDIILGTDPYATEVTLYHDFLISQGSTNKITIDTNYPAFLNGLDLKSETKTPVFDKKPLADKVRDNIQNVFIIK
jgi:hypothetical protein